MKGTLWGGGDPLDPGLDAYTVGRDRELDNRLLPWDILGTMAHAAGLAEIGILSGEEHKSLHRALVEALRDAREGRLAVGPEDEDVHTALEKYLTERLGPLGGKVHAGRSRNDQVLVDLRLFLKERILDLMDALLEGASALMDFGKKHTSVVLPGYTHQRRAMPSSVGLWAGGYAEALRDDLVPLQAALDLVDRSPLGSAAGYGVPLPLPREKTAALLGFATVQLNVTAVQSSRGKLEVQVLQALWGPAYDLGKLSWDVILFTSEEFGFFRLPVEFATGSSIMPQKRNPDLFELTRARAGVLEGLLHQAMAVAGKLPSGYHRDLQLTKGPVMEGADLLQEMLMAVSKAVPALEVDRAACEGAVRGEILATDEALRRVREGTPFREAYRQVAEIVKSGGEIPSISPREILEQRNYPGGAGDPGLEGLAESLEAWRSRTAQRREAFHGALDSLVTWGGETG